MRVLNKHGCFFAFSPREREREREEDEQREEEEDSRTKATHKGLCINMFR